MNVTQIRDLCLEAERLYDLGDVLAARGQAAAAVAAGRAASDRAPHYALGLALTTAGLLAGESGDHEQARQAFDEALAIARAVRHDDPEHAFAILHHVAAFHRDDGDTSQAQELDDESLAILGEAVGTEHLRYQQLKARLARPVATGRSHELHV